MNTNQPSGSFDPQDVVTDVRSISIAQHVIEGAFFSYVESLDKANGASLSARFQEDESFRESAHRATWEALVFSTLANTTEVAVFTEAITSLVALDDPDLQTLRQTMFDFGLENIARNSGGSVHAGRLRARAELFANATRH